MLTDGLGDLHVLLGESHRLGLRVIQSGVLQLILDASLKHLLLMLLGQLLLDDLCLDVLWDRWLRDLLSVGLVVLLLLLLWPLRVVQRGNSESVLCGLRRLGDRKLIRSWSSLDRC